MSQKQWISHDESQEKTAALIKKVNLYLFLAPFVVSIIVGVVLGQFIVFPVIGILCGVALQRMVTASGRSAFSDVVDSPTASDTTHARVYNVVDGLCVVSGDQRPAIVVIDTSFPLAVGAVDSDGSHVIGVSQSFVNEMTRVEVEAVMAHVLWRLRVGHGRLVAYLVGLSRVMSRVGLGFVAHRLASTLLTPELVTLADIAACQATRFPPALASALEKCEMSNESVALQAGQFLSFALPTDLEGATSTTSKVSILEVTRPRLAERVAILKEM
jgi:heat shock protein HtpX